MRPGRARPASGEQARAGGRLRPVAGLRRALRARRDRAGRHPRRGRAGRPWALRAVLARHWLMTALLLAGLVLRVLTQIAYRPVLFCIDSTRYLYHADGN